MRLALTVSLLLAASVAAAASACGSDDAGDGTGAGGSGGDESTSNGNGPGSTTSQAGSGGAGGSGSQAGGGSVGGGGSAPGLSYCVDGCTTLDDCYPATSAIACEQGVCKRAPACAVDSDCPFEDQQCLTGIHHGEDVKKCVATCATDADCGVLKCLGKLKDGGKYCVQPDDWCTSDAGCGNGYGDKCDVETGECTCTRDVECGGMGLYDRCGS